LLFFVVFGITNCYNYNLQKIELLHEEDFNTPVIGDDFQQKWSSSNYPNVKSVCFNLRMESLNAVDGTKCRYTDKIVATGKYKNTVNQTGWGILEVETFSGFAPELQAYAAGLVEGLLTKLQISLHRRNTLDGIYNNYTEYRDRLDDYLNKNLVWISNQVKKASKTDIFWRQVNLTFAQLTGISDGYANANTSEKKESSYEPEARFELSDILRLQLAGDFIDLEKAFNKTANWHASGEQDTGHCSGLVRVTDDKKNLLVSHVSMSGYNTMNRLMKLYKFAYDPKEVPGHTISFSAYAGVLASGDDYTLISSGLLSIETTISVFNKPLYNLVKPEGQLHCWVRSYIANQLARTASEWVELFARYNSGTYNNQWTVVDYKLFKPGQPLPHTDLIWVLEQIPGRTESQDVTWFLRKYNYWPSYNIPFLARITDLSGYKGKASENNWWRWGYAPRALIFHRDYAKVTNITTLMELMRYNDYRHDKFSRCTCTPNPYTAEAAPSTRGDINPENGTYEVAGMGFRNHGAIDYKGTDLALFQKLQIHTIGGPTYGGKSEIPPFNWNTTALKNVSHYGQPTIWEFKPFITEWQTPVQVAGF